MLFLLPPSEGKTAPSSGPALDLTALSFTGLTDTRVRILSCLIETCARAPEDASRLLGLGATQSQDVAANVRLLTSPCAPAIRLYSGVLFEALDFASLSEKARRRGRSRIAIASGLWGLLRPSDRIPHYRLSGGVTLPGVGTLASAWRAPVARELAASPGLIIDLRSSAYAALGPVPAAARRRTVGVRVLQERDGRRTVVSHMNKATKGRILRAALESDDQVSSADDLLDALQAWGYAAELTRSGDSTTVDVIVTNV